MGKIDANGAATQENAVNAFLPFRSCAAQDGRLFGFFAAAITMEMLSLTNR